MNKAASAIVAVAIATVSLTACGTPQDPGQPAEDSPSFSCVDDGNHVCGPDNALGVAAGCYDQGGVLVIPWFNYQHPELDPLYGQTTSPC